MPTHQLDETTFRFLEGPDVFVGTLIGVRTVIPRSGGYMAMFLMESDSGERVRHAFMIPQFGQRESLSAIVKSQLVTVYGLVANADQVYLFHSLLLAEYDEHVDKALAMLTALVGSRFVVHATLKTTRAEPQRTFTVLVWERPAWLSH